MAKKILLLKPGNIYGYSAYPPLGLLAVGTILHEKGYDVRIIDIAAQKDYRKQLQDECKDTALVGIGCYTSETRSAIEITDFIKQNFSIPVIWGSWHPTLFPVQTCQDKNVDAVVIGEGDYSFPELIQHYAKNLPLKDIYGIAYKEAGRVVINKSNGYVDIEQLPAVKYDLIDLSRYAGSKLTDYFSKAKNVWLPYQSSRGCPHRCAFCINTVTDNNRYRAKSAKKVIEEVRELIDKHGLTHLRIIDDNFFVDCRRVRQICQGFIDDKFDITWDAECRVDYFKEGRLDDNLLDLCVKSGLIELTLGCESGSQKILDAMLKDIKVEDIVNGIRQCHRHHIVPRCSFMVGIPGETKEDILLTARLINQLKDIAPEMACGVATFRPYPRSAMCDDLMQKGVFQEPKTLREWSTKKYIEYYTERTHKQPWQSYPGLAQNVSFYYTAAGGVLIANQQIKSSLLKRLNTFFINLANKRVRSLFFGFPLDKMLYNFFYRTYFKYDTYLKNRGWRKND